MERGRWGYERPGYSKEGKGGVSRNKEGRRGGREERAGPDYLVDIYKEKKNSVITKETSVR